MSNFFQNRPEFHSSTDWLVWANTETLQSTFAAQTSIKTVQQQMEMREKAAAIDLADAAVRQSCHETQEARAFWEKTGKVKQAAERAHVFAEDMALAQLVTANKIEQEFSTENPASADVRALLQELTEARIKTENSTRRMVKEMKTVNDRAAAHLLQAKAAETPVRFYVAERQFLLTCIQLSDAVLTALQAITADRPYRDKVTLLEVIAIAEQAQGSASTLVAKLAQRTQYMAEQSHKNPCERDRELVCVEADVYQTYTDIAAQSLVHAQSVLELFGAIIALKADVLAVP